MPTVLSRPLILLVDDTPSNLQVLVEALQPYYEVAVATDGATALKFAAAGERPALILLDIMMPGLDGYEVCRRLKADARTRDVPVIFVTARADPISEEKGFELGAVDYITKPFNVATVRARVRTHLTIQGLLDELEALNQRLTERLAELTRTHEQLRRSRSREELCTRAFESTADGIVVTDADGVIVAVNPAFTRITGYRADEAIGSTPRLLKSGRHPQAFYRELWRCLIETGHWAGELLNRRKNGEIFPELNTISAVRDERGQVTHYVAVFSDISMIKNFQERLDLLTWYDPLTGAGNRLLFMDRLGQAVALCARGGTFASMLLVDIDRFRLVNEARGLPAADRVLGRIAERIRQQLRDGDTLARLGADDFALVLPDPCPTREAAARYAIEMAERVRDEIARAIGFDGAELHLTASVGIAVLPDAHDDTAEEVLRRAETARHRCVAAGGNCALFFESAMGKQVRSCFELEQELHRAVNDDQLELYVQPQVDDAGQICGVEALLRWHHPQRGVIEPLNFIPLAEQSDLIVRIEAWALDRLCALQAELQARGQRIGVALNVCARHLRRAQFVEEVLAAIARHGISAAALTVELTESVLVHDVDDVAAKMRALSGCGVRLSIDDFGVGYSSLGYLRRLPIHELKIDRCFMAHAPDNADDAAIVDTILAVARQLQLDVVAEGVESPAHVAFLDSRHPVRRQGYYYGAPLPAAEWLKTLQSQ